MSQLNEQELVVKYDRLIHKLANGQLFNYESSDVCMDRDDILQMGRIYVLQAIREYDPARGASLTTFVYLKLTTKFMNLARYIKLRNNRGTRNLSSLEWESSSGEIEPFEISEPDDEDETLTCLDAIHAYESQLTDFDKIIFKEYFVECFTVEEIIGHHPRISMGKILDTINTLRSMFSKDGFDERATRGGTRKGWFDGPIVERRIAFEAGGPSGPTAGIGQNVKIGRAHV